MIAVLKLDHRPKRDERVTTHCALVARAFGAKHFFYTGVRDKKFEAGIEKIVQNWGGTFSIQWIKGWREIFKNFDVCHLTMYGLPFEKKISEIRKSKSLLVVVGGPKVPPEIYRSAKWNIAVSSQPHSEIAALAVMLYELSNRSFKKFSSAKLKIVPQPSGKLILRK